MSTPRQILPGITYLLTRRCFQRQFLLRPDRRVNEIFRFCLAYAAQRFHVRIHAYCVLSNHYHLVATDTRSNLPEFMHWLNEYVAKCLNAKLGRWESFWAPGSYSAVRLGGPDDILAKMLYVYLNPVVSRLARRARTWPGAHSLPKDIGAPATSVPRPQGFFRRTGPVPDHVRLEIALPGNLTERDVQLLNERLSHDECRLAEQTVKSGRRFLRKREVLKQSPFSRPRSLEKHRKLSPRVAARDKWRRVELLQRLVSFVAAYRTARLRFIDKDRDVEFPRGTYWMRLHCGVTCAGP